MIQVQKLIESRRDQLAPRGKKGLVAVEAQQFRCDRDALVLERRFTCLLDKGCKVVARRLVADLPVRLSPNEAQVGDIALLEAKTVTPHGSFLDIGIMKDIFVPRTKQLGEMFAGRKYLVKIYIDEQTNRIVASEKLDAYLQNENLSVKRLDIVDLLIYRKTDIGFVVIINNEHSGLLHHNDVFDTLNIGDNVQGFIKKIHEPDDTGKLKYKIDVALGKPGFMKVEDESEKILRLLKENNGFLPYHDKSKPEDIYAFFSMSKKTFKMTTGNLFKQRKINFDDRGIRLI